MTVQERALGWIVGDDTGTSSETIWAVMMGVAPAKSYPAPPYDPADFGRCYRLLAVIPEWRDRLIEMPSCFPEWGPLVDHWGEMEALWLEEFPRGNAPKLYALIKKLRWGDK